MSLHYMDPTVCVQIKQMRHNKLISELERSVTRERAKANFIFHFLRNCLAFCSLHHLI